MTTSESFDGFVDAAAPRLLGLAHALTGNPHDAWDLTQETLARVGLRWKHIDRSDNPHAYARTAMVRLNIDRLRQLRRERPWADVPDTPAEETRNDGLDTWLVDGLASLSPRQRTAIVLRYADDLDVSTIAEQMRCSVGTAKSHLSRGLARLRAEAPAVTQGGTP